MKINSPYWCSRFKVWKTCFSVLFFWWFQHITNIATWFPNWKDNRAKFFLLLALSLFPVPTSFLKCALGLQTDPQGCFHACDIVCRLFFVWKWHLKGGLPKNFKFWLVFWMIAHRIFSSVLFKRFHIQLFWIFSNGMDMD